MEVFVVVLIDCQAILDEWTLMTSHSSGNGPLSRMGDMAAWEPWCLNWPKGVTLAVSRKLCVIIMTPQKVGRLVRENPFMNLHLRKVKYHPQFCILGRLLLKEDNSATQMLWYISYDFPTVSKVIARLQKKTPTWNILRFESQSSESELLKRNQGLFLCFFCLLSNQLFVEFFFHQPWVSPKDFLSESPGECPPKKSQTAGGRLSRPATQRKIKRRDQEIEQVGCIVCWFL